MNILGSTHFSKIWPCDLVFSDRDLMQMNVLIKPYAVLRKNVATRVFIRFSSNLTLGPSF